MVHLEFGQDRLTQPHPLKAFELAQGAIESSVRGSLRFGSRWLSAIATSRTRPWLASGWGCLGRRKFRFAESQPARAKSRSLPLFNAPLEAYRFRRSRSGWAKYYSRLLSKPFRREAELLCAHDGR